MHWWFGCLWFDDTTTKRKEECGCCSGAQKKKNLAGSEELPQRKLENKLVLFNLSRRRGSRGLLTKNNMSFRLKLLVYD